MQVEAFGPWRSRENHIVMIDEGDCAVVAERAAAFGQLWGIVITELGIAVRWGVVSGNAGSLSAMELMMLIQECNQVLKVGGKP